MKKTSFITDVLRSAFLALFISLALIIVFALVVKATELSDGAIKPVYIGIRIFSLLVGLLIGIRELRGGILKGLSAGALFVLLGYLMFAALDGGFDTVAITVIDVVASLTAGVISGILAVNVKKKA